MTFSNHNHINVDNGGNIVDVWHLTGPRGGISYRVHRFNEYSVTCNIEVHRNYCPDKHFRAPDHTNCWLLKAPCWHDGSSTAAECILEEVIEYNEQGDDGAIYELLEAKYYEYLGEKEEAAVA